LNPGPKPAIRATPISDAIEPGTLMPGHVRPPAHSGYVNDPFTELVQTLCPEVGVLERRHFLIVEVDVGLDVEPYAQVARELDDTWYCEIVSTHYLASGDWPIDEFFLLAAGWSPPVDPRDNWSVTVESARDAVRMMVEALRFGRACTDLYSYSWSFGQFPPDDGGQWREAPVPPCDPFGWRPDLTPAAGSGH
jgi:hypothetical protein